MATTIWQATGNAYGDQTLDGTSARNRCTITGAGLGQVRVTFTSSDAAGALSVLHASFAIYSGSGNTGATATPVELLFSGASGFSIAQATSITSDWLTFAIAGSDQAIVIWDGGATARCLGPSGDAGSVNFASSPQYASAAEAGTAYGPTSYGVTKIETQAGGGASLAVKYNSIVSDNGLAEIVNTATTVFMCSALPTSYSAASSTLKLGSSTITFGSPVASTAGDGRKITSTPITTGTINTSGTVSHWAVCDGSRLLAAGEIDVAEAVTAGHVFSLGALSLVSKFA